ncbi:uncharacterized protein At1g43920, Chloroplastic-like [Raphanus sativus]|uniref:Uncharacterized protein At1g43920, Chloroplastic-like n=1 Tax=Raphanus sativus TaxID=3726 RepID=A0A9W3BZ82_RAPSA|nr:uncharacterized protein At1g43920, Chloroplastic-like [Raphanus sativus]XP_056844665.1 uncharacterized protein At1g43920, Chloroplastic-like [Raphanus sativus]XP_056860337.1 uncharacterized protein At1g43920, Chloroplastic-like [Raphanus sativus]XP_056864223.1 uncharacterized protein At1g43920, Chloroplastic-like [Raphanus sativus]
MSSSSEINHGGEIRGFPVKCECGLRVKPYLSKTQENPGRPFYRCITKKDGHLFKWVEDAVCEEVEDAIPKIEIIGRKLTNTITEVDELKTLIKDLKEGVARSEMEIKKWKALMMLCFVCVCFVVICIAFLMFGKAMKSKSAFTSM